ncbi:hypothetical protein F1737_09265 [Methanoplanus sp. FWC-SCC4]|uniref:Uncharacterized protein n=1 Tax=Methanochimaera problematica TaxID=2609417 RepID=A0AA97FEL6_9EURY|nr:hypothetical protein [Methanoplanus sp. FWC-SCC4]WOF16863.1 hypothetical protein F1737_09265 [Methanoplanus sp. FWC-SCC4]
MMGNILKITVKIITLLIIGALVAVIATVSIIGFFITTVHDNSDSVYRYSLSISTSEPVLNPVLLIPVPSYYNSVSGRNETVLDISMVGFRNFDRDNISVKIEYKDGVPMMNISAARIIPVYKNRIEPIMITPEQNVSELPEPTHIYSDRYSEETPVSVPMEIHFYQSGISPRIDTKDPAGKEPLFMPYRILETFSEPEGFMYEDYYISGGTSSYAVEVPFILSYDSGDENILSISTEFEGINQRWVLGWQSNSYHERIRHEFKGSYNGTPCPVKGVLITGDGIYW